MLVVFFFCYCGGGVRIWQFFFFVIKRCQVYWSVFGVRFWESRSAGFDMRGSWTLEWGWGWWRFITPLLLQSVALSLFKLINFWIINWFSRNSDTVHLSTLGLAFCLRSCYFICFRHSTVYFNWNSVSSMLFLATNFRKPLVLLFTFTTFIYLWKAHYFLH